MYIASIPALRGMINKGTLSYYSLAKENEVMQLVKAKTFPTPKHIDPVSKQIYLDHLYKFIRKMGVLYEYPPIKSTLML